MKKGLLILLGMFMMVSSVEAKNGEKSPNRIGVHYNYNDAVSFVERGIQFHVFLNGDFDFNSRYKDSYYDYNGRRTKRHGVRINKDYNGRITRVGNVFINYDYRGNVKRIGNIFMRYRRGNLVKVGNLEINYNRWGNPRFYGNVKNNNYYYNNGVSFSFNFGDICDYNDDYFYRSDFRNNYSQIREDDNYYYYRARPNAKIGKRSTILKRRKQVNNTYKKRSSRSTITRGKTQQSNKRVIKTPTRRKQVKTTYQKRTSKNTVKRSDYRKDKKRVMKTPTRRKVVTKKRRS